MSPDVAPGPDLAPRRATVGLMFTHPAHVLSFGAGSGLSPIAPGTVGTLWGWVSFLAIQQALVHGGLAAPLVDITWALILAFGWLIGCWACTRTAQALRVADPGSVVFDEVWAFWLVLWVMSPVDFSGQLLAFVAFRFFDAAKPGPVAWADQLFKLRPGQSIGWAQGVGIMLDDLVAAACTLFVLALAVVVRQGGVTAGVLG